MDAFHQPSQTSECMHCLLGVRSVVCAQDGLTLNHWRREADEAKPYPYAKFNKSLEIPCYSDEDYKVRGGVDRVGEGCVVCTG